MPNDRSWGNPHDDTYYLQEGKLVLGIVTLAPAGGYVAYDLTHDRRLGPYDALMDAQAALEAGADSRGYLAAFADTRRAGGGAPALGRGVLLGWGACL